ncbi:NUDIX domain-containing protein [archaeon]|jgi:8-oxo-dGTP diphosphatase|nr:NUDIX domain-containing protein [archaeon]MBT4023207.1 NUDIX domain-containing protein [archaeon]MBT4272413.1 NUDIX domain-containing protein [archaeon]MBT4460976.1 NUDIX domain-containing protein [archaeon]MBT4859110.1 NUDIX domain-containing protein [archaeon]
MVYQRAAVIIIQNKKILLMHRIKNNSEYYAIPGGTLEKGEQFEIAAIREIKEETTLDLDLGEKLWEINDGISNCVYFLCKNFTGKAKISGPEKKISSQNNYFGLKWILLSDLNNIDLKPSIIKEKIIGTFL